MNKTLFISKDDHEVEELSAFCAANELHLISKSLIRFESIPFVINKSYDVLFFSSERAARFFIKQEMIPSQTKIACIGRVTAEKLTSLGLEVQFIGEKSGNPKEVALSFKKWLGSRNVLFPQSTISKRTIVNEIPIDQRTEVVVYKTSHHCETIPNCDTYIFTSPSNFDSFLDCNEPPQGKLIAWGETTKYAIEQAGFIVAITLQHSQTEELIKIL